MADVDVSKFNLGDAPRKGKAPADIDVYTPAEPPPWLLRPASTAPLESEDDFINRADQYFEDCNSAGARPTITGLALAVGLPGPTSLIRLGQRVPSLRYPISRCMTAVAHGYEAMIGDGSPAGAIFMLKNIPDFDPDEPVGSPGVQFFNDRKEVLLTADVYGAASDAEEYAEMDPLETYLSIVKRKNAKGITNKPAQFEFVRKVGALQIINEAED